MATENKYSLEDIQHQIIDAVARGDYPTARQLIEVIYQHSQESQKENQDELISLREKSEEFEKFKKDLNEPPMIMGVVLKTNNEDPNSIIVGVSGQRWEVRVLEEEDGFRIQDMKPGQEVWLKSQERVVAKTGGMWGYGMVGTVEGVLEDGRINVKIHANDEVIVERLQELEGTVVRPGDRVLFDPTLAVAFESVPEPEDGGGSSDLLLEEVPDVTYSDIGGLDDVIGQIRETIEGPYRYAELYRMFDKPMSKGILLYGPPGCGKTMVAKAIANSLSKEITRNLKETRAALRLFIVMEDSNGSNEDLARAYTVWRDYQNGNEDALDVLDSDEPPDIANPNESFNLDEARADIERFLFLRQINPSDAQVELDDVEQKLAEGQQAYFISIKGPELLSKWVGETEHSIRRLFMQARKRASLTTPVIIFFDELDALFQRRGSRGNSADMESTVVPQFLSELDGIESLDHVLMIGATNRMDRLDEAILRPGRLDQKIEIQRPTSEHAEDIFRKYVNNEIPFDETEVSGSLDIYKADIVKKMVNLIYHDKTVLRVTGLPGVQSGRSFPCRDFVSGAMFKVIVDRAKQKAMDRIRRDHTAALGVRWGDFREGIIDEIEENKKQYIYTQIDLTMVREGIAIEFVPCDEDLLDTVNMRWLEPVARPWTN